MTKREPLLVELVDALIELGAYDLAEVVGWCETYTDAVMLDIYTPGERLILVEAVRKVEER